MAATACQCIRTADYREVVVANPFCTHPDHAGPALAVLNIPAEA